jgi:hypothetical protein
MVNYYLVTVAGEYEFVKRDDTIKACRAWAKRAFPHKSITVQRDRPYRFCGDCQSAPCCCMLRSDV